ncbi:MAG: Rpn family recombination-promoting nuclease/putative transposase [Treponema bryantii]|nr:Rpn family recombination-promoting nuclease/putative transposase [Treponema bryantii]
MNFIKPIEELTFTDDFMFGYILRDPEICKTLLETLLEIQIDRLEYPELQKSISTFYESKGVRLDVYVKNSNRVFDIEIQNDFQIALPRRTRYYQSMIDMDDLLKGADYSELKESFIIFVCQFDPFKADLPCYTFKNLCLEDNNINLKDGTTKIIFNSTAYEKENNLEISAFLKYIKTKVPTNNFTDRLHRLVEEHKINNKFRNEYFAMNLHDRDITRKAFAEGEALGVEKGISQGAEQNKIETAKKFIKMGFSFEQIAEGTNLSLEKVQQLAEEQEHK